MLTDRDHDLILGILVGRGLVRRSWQPFRFASAAEISAALLTADRLPGGRAAARWWRDHQAIVIGVYFLSSVLAWAINEGLGSTALAVFGATRHGGYGRRYPARSICLFIERVNPRALGAERRRTEPITMVTDTLIAGGLFVDSALLFSSGRSLVAVLLAGLGTGIVLTRLILLNGRPRPRHSTAQKRPLISACVFRMSKREQ